ncbi:uncharacterized protein N7483_010691 [Penicillium malachiteum]|uniref:uncharacterized protein n=1 Tax=Penicillium malachiteum TaxID=1324776 RepID=UPI002548713E|nr:uncharacterized protein N7483_010691 [Penicillium malachiteum]KAJ5713510.1 hypothetical protein N7483_010691 [Penicillium malachiteum]
MLYCELMQLKLLGCPPSSEILRERYFDRVLADKVALTDVPPVWFAPELLQAYPEALVILNRRRDIQDWKCSFRDSILPMMQSWKYWLASWFEAELFWGVWLTRLGHDEFLFKGDFEAHAEKAYIGHYENLEKILEAEGRAYLDWSVEDDWAPLCEFLDLARPDVPFPQGNTAPEFIPKLLTVDDARFRKATTNFFIIATGLVGVMSLYLWR